MLLHKTALAHSALHAGSSAGLSLAERRILIVVDGKRTLDEVVALLGPDILPTLDRLRKDGYLQHAAPRVAPAPTLSGGGGVGGALTGLLRATADALQARSEQPRAGNARPAPAEATPGTVARPAASTVSAQHPHAAPGGARGQRRSLVAAKMYMIDMLQLQRHPDAVECKARIQFASGDDALLDAILDGLRALHRLTSASYGQRIVARLGEALPEHLLPALEQATATLHAPPADATINAPQLKLVNG
ncbi:hypothetical protein [Thermomonas brevis]